MVVRLPATAWLSLTSARRFARIPSPLTDEDRGGAGGFRLDRGGAVGLGLDSGGAGGFNMDSGGAAWAWFGRSRSGLETK